MPKAKEKPTGPEIIDGMQHTVTLDRFYQRNPITLTDADRLEIIKAQRKLRAIYIAKEQSK